jgi:uncharacterized membrane protein YvlD (DUF360 family)
MMALILCLLGSLLSLSLTVYLVPDFVLNSMGDFFLSIVMLSLINFIITPLLLGLNLRIKISSLGLFSFIINLLFLNLSVGLIDEFSIESLNAAIFGAVLMAFFQVWLDIMDSERRLLITRP